MLVAGHAVTITESLQGVDKNESTWYLLPYQKGQVSGSSSISSSSSSSSSGSGNNKGGTNGISSIVVGSIRYFRGDFSNSSMTHPPSP